MVNCHGTCHAVPMLWWIVGIVAVWVTRSALAAVWIGRAISHSKVEEAAAELRYAPVRERAARSSRASSM